MTKVTLEQFKQMEQPETVEVGQEYIYLSRYTPKGVPLIYRIKITGTREGKDRISYRFSGEDYGESSDPEFIRQLRKAPPGEFEEYRSEKIPTRPRRKQKSPLADQPGEFEAKARESQVYMVKSAAGGFQFADPEVIKRQSRANMGWAGYPGAPDQPGEFEAKAVQSGVEPFRTQRQMALAQNLFQDRMHSLYEQPVPLFSQKKSENQNIPTKHPSLDLPEKVTFFNSSIYQDMLAADAKLQQVSYPYRLARSETAKAAVGIVAQRTREKVSRNFEQSVEVYYWGADKYQTTNKNLSAAIKYGLSGAGRTVSYGVGYIPGGDAFLEERKASAARLYDDHYSVKLITEIGKYGVDNPLDIASLAITGGVGGAAVKGGLTLIKAIPKIGGITALGTQIGLTGGYISHLRHRYEHLKDKSVDLHAQAIVEESTLLYTFGKGYKGMGRITDPILYKHSIKHPITELGFEKASIGTSKSYGIGLKTQQGAKTGFRSVGYFAPSSPKLFGRGIPEILPYKLGLEPNFVPRAATDKITLTKRGEAPETAFGKSIIEKAIGKASDGAKDVAKIKTMEKVVNNEVNEAIPTPFIRKELLGVLEHQGVSERAGEKFISILPRHKTVMYGSIVQKGAGKEALLRKPHDIDLQVKSPEKFTKETQEVFETYSKGSSYIKDGKIISRKTGEEIFDVHPLKQKLSGLSVDKPPSKYIGWGYQEQRPVTSQSVKHIPFGQQLSQKAAGGWTIHPKGEFKTEYSPDITISGYIKPSHPGRVKDIEDLYVGSSFSLKQQYKSGKLKKGEYEGRKKDIEALLDPWGKDFASAVRQKKDITLKEDVLKIKYEFSSSKPIKTKSSYIPPYLKNSGSFLKSVLKSSLKSKSKSKSPSKSDFPSIAFPTYPYSSDSPSRVKSKPRSPNLSNYASNLIYPVKTPSVKAPRNKSVSKPNYKSVSKSISPSFSKSMIGAPPSSISKVSWDLPHYKSYTKRKTRKKKIKSKVIKNPVASVEDIMKRGMQGV